MFYRPMEVYCHWFTIKGKKEQCSEFSIKMNIFDLEDYLLRLHLFIHIFELKLMEVVAIVFKFY